jgi:hypothetical protein
LSVFVNHRLLRAGALGLVAGFLCGLFGVGGGILIVPVLVLAMGMDQRLAHGTSLAAVLPIAASGLIGFAVEDSVDYPVAVALIVGAMIGAVVGTHALRVLPTKALARGFSVLLLVSAIRLVLDHTEATGRSELDVLMVVGLLLLGLLSGTLAGLLGVGGGVVLVPAMIVLCSIPAAVAKGTSLLVIIPTSVVATQRNLGNGNAELPTAVVVGLAGVVSAFVASKISVRLDETTSNALFAALLMVVAVRMYVRTLRREPQNVA